ncbi:MAG: tRNA (adenosine(37)-N6)-threonylcarbamoyltransferase complex ATPase subunit type 1 TsaE [Pseudomonadota bacterium]
MPQRRVEISFASPDETAEFAARLAHQLKPGDAVFLSGDLGAGKTHFARAAIQKRLRDSGAIEDVPSPTFTLVQVYQDATTEIWHCDLYRLSNADEVEELGLYEALEGAICFVEWPDRLEPGIRRSGLEIRLHMGDADETRIAHLEWGNERWDRMRFDRE